MCHITDFEIEKIRVRNQTTFKYSSTLHAPLFKTHCFPAFVFFVFLYMSLSWPFPLTHDQTGHFLENFKRETEAAFLSPGHIGYELQSVQNQDGINNPPSKYIHL